MSHEQRWVLGVVGAAVFMLSLDVTIVNVALPSVQRDLGASFVQLQWVVDAYTLALGCTVLAGGSVADLVGRRRVFTLGLALFTGASLGCGLAGSPGVLGAARGVQGLGASLLFATSLALLSTAFPDAHRRRAFAVWGVVAGTAVSLGPVAGGALSYGLSWRWIFLINVPIGLAGLLVGRRRLTESRDPAGGRVDVPGLLSVTGAILLLVVGLLEAPRRGLADPLVLACLLASVALGSAFVRVERRAPRPLVDLSLFGRRAFTGVQASSFLVALGFTSVFGYLALYLQGAGSASPLESGLSLLPVNALSLAAAPLGVRLGGRVAPHRLVAGGAMLVGLGLLAVVPASAADGWRGLLPGLSLMGIGAGLIGPTAADLAVRVAPAARAGMASGMRDASSQVGTATGIAALGALFHAVVVGRLGDGRAADQVAAGAIGRAVAEGGTSRADAVAAFDGAFDVMLLTAGGCVLLGAVAAFWLLRDVPPVPAGHRPAEVARAEVPAAA